MNIPMLTTSSTKQDEINALRKFATCAAPGSYLADLLNPQMLDWVEAKIRDDFVPDLYAALLNAQSESSHYTKEFSVLREAYDRLIIERNEMRAQFDAGLVAVRAETATVRNDLNHLRNAFNDAVVERMGAETRIMTLEDTVVRLKAKIYDLEHTEGTHV